MFCVKNMTKLPDLMESLRQEKCFNLWPHLSKNERLPVPPILGFIENEFQYPTYSKVILNFQNFLMSTDTTSEMLKIGELKRTVVVGWSAWSDLHLWCPGILWRWPCTWPPGSLASAMAKLTESHPFETEKALVCNQQGCESGSAFIFLPGNVELKTYNRKNAWK